MDGLAGAGMLGFVRRAVYDGEGSQAPKLKASGENDVVLDFFQQSLNKAPASALWQLEFLGQLVGDDVNWSSHEGEVRFRLGKSGRGSGGKASYRSSTVVGRSRMGIFEEFQAQKVQEIRERLRPDWVGPDPDKPPFNLSSEDWDWFEKSVPFEAPKLVDLSFPGRLVDGHSSLAAIDAAGPGDAVQLVRDGNRWHIEDSKGRILSRLSRAFAPPADTIFLRGQVAAVLNWRKEDGHEDYAHLLRRDAWGIVLPELVFERAG